jgi:O-succinylbenzoate synthase
VFDITHLTLREIRLPLKEPFRISSGVSHERRILLVHAQDGHGTHAWSECVAGDYPYYSPETIDTTWLAIREWLAPLMLGQAFRDAGDVHERLNARVRGHLMAKAALEMVAWEVLARAAGVPLARLIGGRAARVPAGISLGIQDSADALATRARAAKAEGYRRVKLKIQPGADVAYVGAVREAVGSDYSLSADANSAYRPEDARHLARLDAFGLQMLEQPLAGGDLLRHADLQRVVETPICLDESITSAWDAEDMIRLQAGRVINIKPGRVGGLTMARRIHDVAQAHNVPVWCGGMLESGIGRGYNVALASLPNFRFANDLSPSARYWTRDIVRPEWTMDDGMITVPLDRPGIGVEPDVDRIDDLTIRAEALHT